MKNVVQRVTNGEADWVWHPIRLEAGPESPIEIKEIILEIKVMKDAMKLDGIRFMVTAKEQQEIADMIYGIFHTERTHDARHVHAQTTIGAMVQVPPNSGKITALSNEEDYSKYVDKAIEEATGGSEPGLVSTVGKPWALTNNMLGQQKYGDKNAYNYGWHDKNGIYKSRITGIKIWQPIISGMSKHVHNWAHADPSQVCEMPSREAKLIFPDGFEEEVDLAWIYTHELYHHFVTDGRAPMSVVRQPAVEEKIEHIVFPPITIRS